MFKSLLGEKPDVLPASPCYLSLFLADFARAYYIEQYRGCTKVQLSCLVGHAQDTHFQMRAVYQL